MIGSPKNNVTPVFAKQKRRGPPYKKYLLDPGASHLAVFDRDDVILSLALLPYSHPPV